MAFPPSDDPSDRQRTRPSRPGALFLCSNKNHLSRSICLSAHIGGKSLVTFEELYDMTNPDEPKKVTEHKDITDDGQTVTIKEVPEVPDTPKDTDTPDTPSTVTKTSDSPKTGDNTNIYAYLAMLGLSCVGLGGMLYFKRRRKKS